MIASLVSPIEWDVFVKEYDEMKLVLHKQDNPYSATMDASDQARSWREQVSRNAVHFLLSSPVVYATQQLAKRHCESPCLQVNVTLFRRHNAKSVCLLNDSPLRYPHDDTFEEILYHDKDICIKTDCSRIDLPTNKSILKELVSRLVLFLRLFCHLLVQMMNLNGS